MKFVQTIQQNITQQHLLEKIKNIWLPFPEEQTV